MDNKDLPAYPITLKPGEVFDGITNINGLSKREYVATMVLQGILANHWCQNDFKDNIHAMAPDKTANQAVMFADELLKQLES